MQEECDHIEKEVNDFIARLSEHCTSIRVFAEFHQGTDTAMYTKGSGSYYAQLGMVREFINKDESRIHHEIKKREYTDE